MPKQNNGNIDDLLHQMQEDEKADLAAQTNTITPTNYAKLRGIYPQRVYAAIRNNKLQSATCACGRRVINLDEADKLFGKTTKEGETNER